MLYLALVLFFFLDALILAAILLFFRYVFSGKYSKALGKGYALRTREYGSPDSGDGPLVLFFNGWSPGMMLFTPSDYLAGRLSRETGARCMTVFLRGQGSPGDISRLTRADFLEDAICAYDAFLKGRAIEGRRIVVVGESFGAYLSAVLSTKRRVDELVLRVPSDFPDEGFESAPQIGIAGEKSQWWKSLRHEHGESRALDAVHGFEGRIILVYSGKDEIVPFSTTENYLRAAEGSRGLETHEMKDAGHGLMRPRDIAEFYAIIKKAILDF
jgi:uncharacterized protein